ncbi:MAG: YraN family protein [Rhodobacteraceae bacterium]|nr:YraN family protein [Paracoccaceae bacterium]
MRQETGKTAYYAGDAAEQRVACHYVLSGHDIVHRRWRGAGGEIDLIARDGDTVVFIEVKKSKTFAQAAASLGQRQIARIYSAAEAFLADEPAGSLTDTRIDVALVDAAGQVSVLENAILAT